MKLYLKDYIGISTDKEDIKNYISNIENEHDHNILLNYFKFEKAFLSRDDLNTIVLEINFFFEDGYIVVNASPSIGVVSYFDTGSGTRISHKRYHPEDDSSATPVLTSFSTDPSYYITFNRLFDIINDQIAAILKEIKKVKKINSIDDVLSDFDTVNFEDL